MNQPVRAGLDSYRRRHFQGVDSCDKALSDRRNHQSPRFSAIVGIQSQLGADTGDSDDIGSKGRHGHIFREGDGLGQQEVLGVNTMTASSLESRTDGA